LQLLQKEILIMEHSSEFLAIVDDAKKRIKEVSVSETRKRLTEAARRGEDLDPPRRSSCG